jgi:hypothetical protein
MLVHDSLQKLAMWHKKWCALSCTHLNMYININNWNIYLINKIIVINEIIMK